MERRQRRDNAVKARDDAIFSRVAEIQERLDARDDELVRKRALLAARRAEKAQRVSVCRAGTHVRANLCACRG